MLTKVSLLDVVSNSSNREPCSLFVYKFGSRLFNHTLVAWQSKQLFFNYLKSIISDFQLVSGGCLWCSTFWLDCPIVKKFQFCLILGIQFARFQTVTFGRSFHAAISTVDSDESFILKRLGHLAFKQTKHRMCPVFSNDFS